MTNLKDKLSASVRHAKGGIQSAAPPATPLASATEQRRRAKAPATATPGADPSPDVVPVPKRAIPSAVPTGFALPDRVWPD